MAFAQRHDAIETLFLDGPHKSLGIGIQVRASRWKPDEAYAAALEGCAKSDTEKRIAVNDQVPLAAQEPVNAIRKVSSDLLHPGPVGVASDTCDLHPPSSQIDDKKDEVADQTSDREHFNGEKVGGSNGAPVGLEERRPRGTLPTLRRRLDSVPDKNSLDRAAPDIVPKVVESPANPGVAPLRVVAGHGKDEIGDDMGDDRTARLATGTAIVLFGDELAVPPEDGVWRHNGVEQSQGGTAEQLTLLGEA